MRCDHPGRVKQDRGRLRRVSRSVGNQALEPPGLPGGQRVGKIRHRPFQHYPRRRWLAGQMHCPGGLQPSPRPAASVWRELGRPLQERGVAGPPAAAAGSFSRPFEFGRDLLVQAGRGFREMPCPAVRIARGVDDSGQRLVRAPAFRSRRGVICRRTHHGVTELDPGRECQ
jgi:hypothetical protein